jgi:hypothetical protein
MTNQALKVLCRFQQLPICIATLKHPRWVKLAPLFLATIKKPILNLLLYQGHEKKTQKIIPSCKSKENKTDPVKHFFIAIKLGFIP